MESSKISDTRMPFETPAETDELFESNARREAEARLGHLIELKGIGLLTGEVGSPPAPTSLLQAIWPRCARTASGR